MITKRIIQSLKDDHRLINGPVYETLMDLGININDLRVITDLTTKRAEVDYQDGLLVLDKSFYGESIDFELEYEVKDYKKDYIILTTLIKPSIISHYVQHKNKIKRATAANTQHKQK